MTLYQCYLVENACYKEGVYRNPTGIVVHSTGANNPNLQRYVQPADGQTVGLNPGASELKNIIGSVNYGNHWNQYYADGSQGRYACVNAFIGKVASGVIATVQTLPWNMMPWGCGSGNLGSYNNTHVQFEICEDTLTDEVYFNYAMTEAAELCAYLCNLYNISINNVVSHHESYLAGMGNNHSDIDHWLTRFNKDMNWFRNLVNEKLKEQKENEPMTAEEKQAFNELRNQVTQLDKKIADVSADEKLLHEQVYPKWAYIDNNLPEWARETVVKLANDGVLQGNDQNSLELSYLFLRILVILDRAGCFTDDWSRTDSAMKEMKETEALGIMDATDPQMPASRAALSAIAKRLYDKVRTNTK